MVTTELLRYVHRRARGGRIGEAPRMPGCAGSRHAIVTGSFLRVAPVLTSRGCPLRMPRPGPCWAAIAPSTFLRRFWQKEARLVRGAVPGFAGLFSREELFALAGRDDVESRLVVRSRGHWTMEHGPFRRARFQRVARDRLDAAGAGSQSPFRCRRCAVAALLLPALRAPRRPDGELRRARWRRRAALRFLRRVPAAGRRPPPLAIRPAGRSLARGPDCRSRSCATSRRSSTRSWRRATCCTCRLPYAHDGVAVDACTTYSVGFRAASHTEIAQAFLDHLRDEIALDGPLRRPRSHGIRRAGAHCRGDAATRRCRSCAESGGTARPRRASSAPSCRIRSRTSTSTPPDPRTVARGICAGHRPARRRARPAHAMALR